MLMIFAIGILCLMALAIPPVADQKLAELPAASGEKWWRMVKAEASMADMYVLGDIVADWWDGWKPDDSYPLKFQNDLAELGDVDVINLHINSMGGDVFAAYAISAMLRNHPARVIAHIDGVAASAASILAIASANEVVAPANASLMIHLPSLQNVSGNENDMLKYYGLLSKFKDGLIEVYHAKTGIDREQLVEMMSAATWMTAQEAADHGFIDSVVSPVAIAACATEGRYVINGNELDFSGIPELPKALLETAATDDEPDKPAITEEEADNPVDTQTDVEAEEQELSIDEPADEEPAENRPVDAGGDDPVAADRARVIAIMALSRPGAEEIIETAIADGSEPGAVALRILHSDTVKNATKLHAMRTDAPEAVAPEAESKPKSKGGLIVEAYKRLTGQTDNS